MPIPTGEQAKRETARSGAAVSLPVLAATRSCAPEKRHIRPSKMGPIRAAVLIGVNLLMAGHIILWVTTGMRRTVSPVEPSESMYTLETGLVNAGFIFFTVAILSTFILGRWFCGWGCHIVALQDACAWVMKKAGVKPKPFRSRLLVFAPLLLALYMFAWPTFKREVIKPVAGQHWAQWAPYVGEVGERPKLGFALTKEKFWQTFPPWYVAIPFLALCGFGSVYFLGAKGYCTYGCPYGGFFGPADRLAPGRILVTDACEHCGHCTSVCTSNVRVHEEVRDFGMVVDPGCMRCLDCVSVCPNDALYFGFAKPPLLTAPKRRRLYDAPIIAEVALFLIGIALFLSYRDMLGAVPMLMATGIGAIGVFLCWKSWELLSQPSVRIQSLQLKLKGRLRPLGAGIALLTLSMLAAGAWGAMVHYSLWRGNVLAEGMRSPLQSVLTTGYVAPADERALAEKTLRELVRASAPRYGGIGWIRTPENSSQAAYLNLVLGRFADAETWLSREIDESAVRNGKPAPDVTHLARIMQLRGAPLEEVITRYREIVSHWPASAEARLTFAGMLIQAGDENGAVEQATAAVAADPTNAGIAYTAGGFLGKLGKFDGALTAYSAAIKADPKSGAGWMGAALAYGGLGNNQKAEECLRYAMALEPSNPLYMQSLAELLQEEGRAGEASALQERANALNKSAPVPGEDR